jgi:hypothetical protein
VVDVLIQRQPPAGHWPPESRTASVVRVCVEAQARILCVAVDDDGQGGADLVLGSGLLGLKDRAEAIGGTMSLQSAPGEGASLRVELPLDDQDHGDDRPGDLRRRGATTWLAGIQKLAPVLPDNAS